MLLDRFTFQRYNLPTLGKPLQLHNSPGNCAGELCKPSKDVASLLVCIEKSLKVFGFGFFVGDVISGISLGVFG